MNVATTLSVKEKKRDYDRQHKAVNRERYRAIARAYYAKSQEKCVEYQRKWRTENQEKVRQSAKKSRVKNPEYMKEWVKKNPLRVAGYVKKWLVAGGREKVRSWEREKWATDLSFRMGKILRNRIRGVLKGKSKACHTMEFLGCSISNFILYLESKFEEGMIWGNYGFFWEIDHIIPCALFDLTKPDHQRRCFHFSNQQPLTVHQNRVKHKKYQLSVIP